MRAASSASVRPCESCKGEGSKGNGPCAMARRLRRACSAVALQGVVLLAIVFAFAFAASADVAVPPLTGRVVDLTNTLRADDLAALTEKLESFEDRKGSQITVLIVPTTQPETIEQYSIRVAEAWKIGRKKADDGAILLIAKNDRRLRIEVGYGLEGALTDLTSRRIIDEEIAPKLKSGDFAGGITAGVDRMISVIDGEPLPEPTQRGSSDQFDATNLFNPFFIVVVFMFSGLFRNIFGRLVGAVVASGAAGLLVWLIAGSIVTALIACAIAFFITLFGGAFIPVSGPMRGGWSGGSSGGGWSSGSSGGGFSGGGGSFGGGGASGSW